MSEVKLVATTRSEFGKGAARRLRRADQIPAVLYGHGSDPLHVALPGHDTMLAVKHANALFAIELDGKTTLAITKDVQRDVVKNTIEHVDLLIVKKGEKVTVDVHVAVVGESYPGTIHVVETQTLSLEVEATHIPTEVEVSIEGLHGRLLHHRRRDHAARRCHPAHRPGPHGHRDQRPARLRRGRRRRRRRRGPGCVAVGRVRRRRGVRGLSLTFPRDARYRAYGAGRRCSRLIPVEESR